MSRKKFGPSGLARMSATHPWVTLVAWVVIAAAILVGGSLVHQKDYEDDFTGSPDSQVGANIIDEKFGEQTTASESVVIVSDGVPVSDPAFKSVVDGFLGNVRNVSSLDGEITSIVNYYDAPDAPEMQSLVSAEGNALLIPISFQGDWTVYDGPDYVEDWQAAIDSSEVDGFQIGSVGDITSNEINEMANADMAKDIQIGLPAAAVILLVVFGALVAAGLPLILGVMTILTAMGLSQMLGGLVVIDETSTSVVTMIGLAVGIDYALFFLERYREERRHGAKKVDAVERAGGTAGKAVLFSGGTVLLALLGLLLMPITIFQGMGLGTAMAVVVAVVGALTLLPAMIALCGDWVNFPRFNLLKKLRTQDRTGVAQFKDLAPGEGMWGRLGTQVMRRPALFAGAAGGLLLLLSVPVLTMELGQQSISSYPDGEFTTSYEMLSEHFYAGQDDPVNIVVTEAVGSDATQQQIEAFTTAVSEDTRYGDLTTRTSEDGEVIVIDLLLKDDPFMEAGQDALADLRSEYIPDAFGDSADSVYVTGGAAFIMDFNSVLGDNLPIVFAFVLGLSFVLLMIAFRSIVVPAMSIILNLLSVGAAYGAVVLVFQHGWGADFLGLTQVDVITNWLPLMLFCILFGLSMDYHVFLLSRIKEHWDHSGDNEASIVAGLQSTGRIITGAALIMVAVFSAFALGRLPEMQQMGFGLAVAVLLDATLIRTVLVPATMRLLGDKNWYMPKVLQWLPQINVEGKLEPIRLQRLENEQASAD